MAPRSTIHTPLCTLLGIKHPIVLAGMARVSAGKLAAAVSNAGGLGVVGGLGYTPTQLQEIIDDIKAHLRSPDLPFGVDLALPQIGGSARKTNHDYTEGKLDELVEVIIKNKAKLFVCAVGVPPRHVVEKLHAAGILVMNMVGAPRHAVKALEAGVDILCAQGTEGGGHTGDIAGTVLIPAVVDIARKYKSPLTNQPVMVLAAGGISDGRGLAASLMHGAVGVWVGTRFVASTEANCSEQQKRAVVEADYPEMIRTLVLTGRPLRMKANEYVLDWESRPDEIAKLTSQGIVPIEKDFEDGKEIDIPHIMGQVAGRIKSIEPAATIVNDMIREAVEMLNQGTSYITAGSAL